MTSHMVDGQNHIPVGILEIAIPVNLFAFTYQVVGQERRTLFLRIIVKILTLCSITFAHLEEFG